MLILSIGWQIVGGTNRPFFGPGRYLLVWLALLVFLPFINQNFHFSVKVNTVRLSAFQRLLFWLVSLLLQNRVGPMLRFSLMTLVFAVDVGVRVYWIERNLFHILLSQSLLRFLQVCKARGVSRWFNVFMIVFLLIKGQTVYRRLPNGLLVFLRLLVLLLLEVHVEGFLGKAKILSKKKRLVGNSKVIVHVLRGI